MILILAMLALAAWAIPATALEIARDGYRRRPTRTDYDSARPV